MTNVQSHVPVMLDEVMAALEPRDGATYVDATFGAGGYSQALLDAANCTVWGIDRDPLAAALGHQMAARYPGRLTVLSGRYSEIARLLADVGVEQIDGVALDLGVSSMQLDDPSRGFSFRGDGPLDMRMGNEGTSAADVVNEMAEAELADIIYRFGEERASRRVAKAIVELRQQTAITRTSQLAELIRSVVRKSKDGLDPATRTFQALRIYVNEELKELEQGLRSVELLLAPGGRLAVVCFHSLEDRQVKEFLKSRSGAQSRPSRHLPVSEVEAREPTFRLIRRGAVKPTPAESARNPRARSARLRCAERTGAPVREAA
jgi:16S rRNA (cytosine1402-N4)-methyltransferase